MKILEKGNMPDGTQIQIENWNEDLSFMSYGSTIGAYPKSKQTIDRYFAPKLNRTFRFQLDFEDYDEAQEAFRKLSSGECTLIDYKANFRGKKDLLTCV